MIARLWLRSARQFAAPAIERVKHVAEKVRVQVGQVKEQPAESARVDEALQLEVVDRTHAEATLRMIVEDFEAETGERFFPSLVRHLADALGVQYAFASEMS